MKLLFEERLRAIRGPPSDRLTAIGVRAGMSVADLGAGRGYYALAAAEIVGSGGKLYAVEPDKVRSTMIEGRATSEGLANLRVIANGAEDLTAIPESTVDLAFSMNSMHHFNDRMAVFSEVARVLKPGSRFYVRDIMKSWVNGHGTRREQVAEMPGPGFSDRKVRVTRSTLEATFTK